MRRSQAIVVGHHGEVLRAIGEFAAGAGNRKCEYDDGARNRLVLVIFNFDHWIALDTLLKIIFGAFSLLDYYADSRRDCLSEGRCDGQMKRQQETESRDEQRIQITDKFVHF